MKTRIAILGLGGVGGYFGGLLAAKYYQSTEVEVIFIARPTTERIINEKGFKLITPEGEQIIKPALVKGAAQLTGQIDIIVCATKAFDLEDALLPLKSCIGERTSILPLLNGVDARERITKLFPATDVWDGCVYIVSRQLEPGVVKITGNLRSLYFGSSEVATEKQKLFEKLCIDAGIDCHLSANITQTIWEKFLFISGMASATSYLNLSIGEIMAEPTHKELLLGLFNELKAVADKIPVPLANNIVSKTMLRAEKLPFETTSSMHSDYKKGSKTEVETLTGYVVRLGEKLGVETPLYEKVYKGLLK